jgi:hypothetical protein
MRYRATRTFPGDKFRGDETALEELEEMAAGSIFSVGIIETELAGCPHDEQKWALPVNSAEQ